MSVTDPIADALTKIRNAYRAGHKQVTVNYSNFTEAIVKVLSEENYINNYEILEKDVVKKIPFKRIFINLRYTNNGRPVITGIQRVSKPGRRIYVKSKDVPRVFNNIGCAIISTNQGVFIDRKARELNVGGEYVCKVW